ncbi:MAG: N-acetylneuraminate synthase family protein [Candidatus Latescibacterota bacterium]|nr:N-acetylneuraminate synthase family protein [Candidatus Latescibacterota bacterium]
MEFTFGGEKKTIGEGHQTFFVAEEGQYNNGRFPVALEMIDLAADSGADAIEFQLAIADDFYIPSHPLHAIYVERQFSPAKLEQLFFKGIERGIPVYASPLSSNLVEKLAKMGCPLFNITSSDINNPEMLDAVVDSGRPFFISTAMADLNEVDWAVSRVVSRAEGRFGLLHGQHIMLTGTGSGVPVDQVSLGVIGEFASKFGCPVGFIDHTSNPDVPGLAVAAGASIVTKHLIPDRSLQGPDWHICLEPKEFKLAADRVREAQSAVGDVHKVLAPGESKDQAEMRRSIVANRPLHPGTILSKSDLAYKRPGTGLPPSAVDRILGRRLKIELSPNDQIDLIHLENPTL